MKEFARKHRPSTLNEVLGQADAVRILSEWLKKDSVPHCIVFAGPSGCGKTTFARILRKEMGCSPFDFYDLNCAKDSRGIETIRNISNRMGYKPHRRCRMWLFDEAHKLSNDAQNALLKVLEDPPSHAYFMLCTTEPEKLIRTIRTRASMIAVKALAPREIAELVRRVATLEHVRLGEGVVAGIVNEAQGSARQALSILYQLAQLPEKQQLRAIGHLDHAHEAIEIARALLNSRTGWPEMTKILAGCNLKEAERIRHLVLSYCTQVLLNRSSPRAAMLIDYFRDNFYDSQGAGLVATCYEIVTSDNRSNGQPRTRTPAKDPHAQRTPRP
jgi:DNA polymerase III gamma/tau subunit